MELSVTEDGCRELVIFVTWPEHLIPEAEGKSSATPYAEINRYRLILLYIIFG